MKINKGIIVISETNDEVLLKIGNTDQIIRLKPIEFKIIKHYARLENNVEVISHFKDTIRNRRKQFKYPDRESKDPKNISSRKLQIPQQPLGEI